MLLCCLITIKRSEKQFLQATCVAYRPHDGLTDFYNAFYNEPLTTFRKNILSNSLYGVKNRNNIPGAIPALNPETIYAIIATFEYSDKKSLKGTSEQYDGIWSLDNVP